MHLEMPTGKMMEEPKHNSLKRIGFKTEFKSLHMNVTCPDLNASFPPNSHLKELLIIQIISM